MKKLISLTKFFLATSVDESSMSSSKKKKTKFKKILSFLGVILSIVFVAFYINLGIDNSKAMLGEKPDTKAVYSLFGTLVIIVNLVLVAFIGLFSSFQGASQDKNAIFINTLPISKYAIQISRTLAKSNIIIRISGLITILFAILVPIKLAVPFSISFLITGLILSIFIVYPIMVIVETVVNLSVFLISKLIPKKNIEAVFTFLFIIAFYIIYGAFYYNSKGGSDAIKSTTTFVESESVIANIVSYLNKAFTGEDILAIPMMLIASTSISAVFTFIAANINAKILLLLTDAGNANGLFSKKLTKEEEAKKTAKELSSTKSLSKEGRFISREISSYINSPMLVVGTILPIVIMPIIMIIFGYLGFMQGLEKKETQLKEYEMTLAISEDKKEKINVIEMFEQEEQDLKKIKEENNITKEEAIAKVQSGEIISKVMVEHITKYSKESYEKAANEYKGYKGGLFVKNEALNTIKKGLDKDIKVNPEIIVYVILGFTALMLFSESLSYIVISKEKNEMTMLKVLPISFKKQFNLKVGVIKAFLFAIIAFYVILSGVILRERLLQIEILLGLIASILIIYTTIDMKGFLDLINPNFNWKTEMEMQKNSKNSIFALILTIILITINVGAIMLLNKFNVYSFKNFMISVFSIQAILFILLEFVKYKFMDRLYIMLKNN